MKRSYFTVILVFVIFFYISLLTNIMTALNPDAKAGFQLSYAMVAFLPFAFFIAYGVLSIPAGILVERFREKPVMVGAMSLAFIGSLLFTAAPKYSVFMVSLFLIGSCMAVLQVAINPLLRVAGGEEHFAFNSVMAQLIFGAASFLSPKIYSYLVVNLRNSSADRSFLLRTMAKLVPTDLPWVSLYWIFALCTVVMIVLVWGFRLPRVELKEEEKTGAWATYRELLRNRVVWLYFFGIFAYVGTEQGVGNWISQFLSTYHGFDPQTKGATAVSYFWGLMTVGCLLGLLLLKIWDSRRVLICFSLLAIATLTAALLGPAQVSYIAFPMIGFFASVMWSIIFSLALNSFEHHHGSFSGILVTGIIGAALVPLIIGGLGDLIGLRQGMFFLYLTLGYVLSIGFWAKPLIANATFGKKKEPNG